MTRVDRVYPKELLTPFFIEIPVIGYQKLRLDKVPTFRVFVQSSRQLGRLRESREARPVQRCTALIPDPAAALRADSLGPS